MKMCTLNIRKVEPSDLPRLADLAFRAKASWGYDDDFMQACQDELTLSTTDILEPANYHALAQVDKAHIVGYYALRQLNQSEAELDALFVEPGYFGRGIGATLLMHALNKVLSAGVKTLVVQSDPHARDFYAYFGAHLRTYRPSQSIPGRSLPLLEFRLSDPTVLASMAQYESRKGIPAT